MKSIYIVIVVIVLAALIIGIYFLNAGTREVKAALPEQTKKPVADQTEPTPKTTGAPQADYVEGELIAVVETKAEAEQIAALYGITLKTWEPTKLAVFTTDRDIFEVIAEGEKNGWPQLSPNQIYYID